MPRLAALEIGDRPELWRRAGFHVDVDGGCRVSSVRLWLRPTSGDGAGDKDGRGIRSWTLTGVGDVTDVDGIPTVVGDEAPVAPAEHPNGVDRLDHVVVATPDVDRTTAALERIGLEARRTREVADAAGGTDAGARRQVFFWAGEVILEVVGPASPAGDGPARLWGLAFASDLDATAAQLGDLLGAPRPAVQPGRRIATLRRDAGLTVPVAFMSPHRDPAD